MSDWHGESGGTGPVDLVCRVCGAVGGHIEAYPEPDGASVLVCMEPRTGTRDDAAGTGEPGWDRSNMVVGFVDKQVQRTLCGGLIAVVMCTARGGGES